MAKLAIIANFETEPGGLDELFAALRAHRDRCLKDEPGTLRFEILTTPEKPAQVFLYEVYEDDDAFDRHRSSPSILRFREETSRLGAKLSFAKYVIMD